MSRGIDYIGDMRTLVLIAALALLPLPAWAVDWHVGVRTDNVRIGVGSKGVRARIGYPLYRHGRRDGWRDRHRRDRWWRPRYYVVAPPTAPKAEAPGEKPVRVATPPEPVVDPVVPPDPQGNNGRYRALGAAPARDWQVGDFLPPGVPHVKLAHDAYDLPAPPDGQIYARVRGDVLLIDALTRRVEAIVGG